MVKILLNRYMKLSKYETSVYGQKDLAPYTHNFPYARLDGCINHFAIFYKSHEFFVLSFPRIKVQEIKQEDHDGPESLT